MSEPHPVCPVTGEPATRLVQWVTARFLTDLWRIEMGVDVAGLFAGIRRFGLWESPTGLYFFDPPIEGDRAFYETFYARLYTEPASRLGRLAHRLLLPRAVVCGEGVRPEFPLAARHARAGDRVLDVGCGPGIFRRVLPPECRYVGLEPHLGRPDPFIRAETLERHLEENSGAYDLVASFQVLEHVRDPLGFLGRMVEAARPGGTVAIGVPQVPSAHSRIPNNLINAVPHHLTWWTKPALEAAAARAGLVEPVVEAAPWGEIDALLYWMDRCSPVTCRDRHYRHAWSWHAATAVSALGAVLMSRLRTLPKGRPGDEGGSLLMVARKPG